MHGVCAFEIVVEDDDEEEEKKKEKKIGHILCA